MVDYLPSMSEALGLILSNTHTHANSNVYKLLDLWHFVIAAQVDYDRNSKLVFTGGFPSSVSVSSSAYFISDRTLEVISTMNFD